MSEKSEPSRRVRRPVPVGVGGCSACDKSANTSDYEQKCRAQRIPINVDIAAPPAVGQQVSVEFVPDHSGNLFIPDGMVLRAEAVLPNGATVPADEVFLHNVTRNRVIVDCLAQTEKRGVAVNFYNARDCCVHRVCIPEFEHDGENNKLTMTFISEQVLPLPADPTDPDSAIVATPVAARVRGYFIGRCTECGFESVCKPEGSAANDSSSATAS